MTTTGQRLVHLSGLTGVSAAEHLKRIAGAAGSAGNLLVAYSRLATATAAVHIMVDHIAQSDDDVVLRRPRKRVRKQHRDEDVLLFIGAM